MEQQRHGDGASAQNNGRWTYPRTLKELSAAVGMSPKSFKRYLDSIPGSYVVLRHTWYQVCLDRVHPGVRTLLEPLTLPPRPGR